DRKALAQRRDRRALHTDPRAVGDRRHLRPAALGDDRLILRDRGLGGLGGRRRQSRQRLFRQPDIARSIVEAGIEAGLLVFLEQLVQHLVGRLLRRTSSTRHRARGKAGAKREDVATGERARHGRTLANPVFGDKSASEGIYNSMSLRSYRPLSL